MLLLYRLCGTILSGFSDFGRILTYGRYVIIEHNFIFHVEIQKSHEQYIFKQIIFKTSIYKKKIYVNFRQCIANNWILFD